MECKGSREILERIVTAYKSGLPIEGLLENADFYLNSTFVLNNSGVRMPVEIDIEGRLNPGEIEFRQDGRVVAKIVNIKTN